MIYKEYKIQPELTLLRLLLRKESFNKYFEYVDLKSLKDECKEICNIYRSLEELHGHVETDITVAELQAWFFSTYPDAPKDTYEGLFTGLSEAQIGDEVGEVLLSQIKRRQQALKLSETLYSVSQGREPDNLEDQLKEFYVSPDTTRTLLSPVTTDLTTLINRAYAERGIRWRLGCLNKSLGSLRKGDFGFIFARPETGKTTFLASECSYFLSQGARVVWFNNEEQGGKVMLRVFQAWFGATLEQVLANVYRFNAEFQTQVGNNLRMYDAATISKREVEKVVEEDKPDIVVYDQLPKIKGFTADRNDLELGAKFQWARELAKNSHAAIGVSQADGTAEGVRYLSMEHVANVKTAVQAEADFILGIGKDRDKALELVRYLNISKNKLLGDSDSIPSLRHGRFETLIDPTIARYEDTVEYA